MARIANPSKYQAKLFDFIEHGEGNALVAAVAGSGKSTSLIHAMSLIKPSKTVRFFAFGKDIVEDLKTKVPHSQNISVSTIHSYGMRAIMKHCDVKPEIDDRKYNKYVDDMYIDMKDGTDTLADFRRRVMPLINLAMVNMANTWELILEMTNKYDLPATENDCKMVLAMIRRGEKELGTISMTDMIHLPVALKMKVDKFDFVMIDECQDLSELQRALVLMAVRKGGRYIAVGDERQAIFGFAGADADSFNKFRLLPNTTELPLSVCYRCPKEVIKLAQRLVPQIEAFESNGEGIVNHDDSVNSIQAGDMILCRSTYPLVKLGFQYIAAGIKAVIVGRDIGKNLVTMIRKTKATSFDTMYEKFKIELEKIESDLIQIKGLSKDDVKTNTQYSSFVDKVDAIRVVADGCGDLEEVIDKIEKIFSDDKKDGIILSTIHKAKGLEANNVYIIHPELMPSKNAKLDWEKQQEQNLMYVAYTRPKRKLGFVTDFDAYSGQSVVKAGRSTKVESKSQEFPTEPTYAIPAALPNIGDVVTNEYTIQSILNMTSKFGSTKKYVMISRTGITVTKLGSMQHAKVVDGKGLVEGSRVRIKAPIKSIYNGQLELGMLEVVE